MSTTDTQTEYPFGPTATHFVKPHTIQGSLFVTCPWSQCGRRTTAVPSWDGDYCSVCGYHFEYPEGWPNIPIPEVAE